MTLKETKQWIEKEAELASKKLGWLDIFPIHTIIKVAFVEGGNLVLNTLVAERDQEIKRFLKGAINQYNKTEEKVTEIRQFRKNIEAKDAEIAELRAASEKMAKAIMTIDAEISATILEDVDIKTIINAIDQALSAWNALTKKAE